LAQGFYAYLMMSADLILIISLPLQLRLLTILLSRNRQFMGLHSDFFRCLTHILMTDLISAFINILLVEPATYGLFREFYENNSGWMSKLVIFQGSPLCILSVYFHCMISLNRLTAIIFTMHHQFIWTTRNQRIVHFCGWFLAVICSLPLIWPIQGSYVVLRSPFNTRGLSFVIVTTDANIAYQ
ncbi:hypothetical protein PENTCL1PPCAC_6314, partial [Pristionchus entomophagus]